MSRCPPQGELGGAATLCNRDLVSGRQSLRLSKTWQLYLLSAGGSSPIHTEREVEGEGVEGVHFKGADQENAM